MTVQELKGARREYLRSGARIEDLRRKIDEMEQMAATLEHLASCCSGDNRPDRPVLADLESTREIGGDEPKRLCGTLRARLQ